MQYQENGLGQQNLGAKEKMVRGSMWMTIGSFVSRFMGAIYIIPWYAWMGENGNAANALMGKGYNIYALFLMISTAGIPGAIARQISHYNSLNEYKLSKKLFQKAMLAMVGLGVVFAGIMYFASPILAEGDTDLIPSMRALSLAVLIFPCMSVIRGFFQGNQDMMPSAVSQIVEQLVRVFYMLLSAFIIMKVMKKSYVAAVTQGTLAAFIGMLGAVAVLLWFYQKNGEKMRYLEEHSSNKLQLSTSELLKEIIVEAIPFVIVGSAITIFKIVDQYTFERIMRSFTDYSDGQLKELFSIFSFNPDKLTMIIISLATSLSVTSLPLITEAYTLKNRKGLAQMISDNLQLFFFIMVPATLGMVVVAEPLYTLFYKHDVLGTSVLVQACYVGLILGFSMLVSTTLQGLYNNKKAMINFGIGLLVKIIVQYPMVKLFEVYGPLLATAIGFLVIGFLTVRDIKRMTNFNVSLTARRTLLIFIFSIIMVMGAILTKKILYIFLTPTSKFQSFIIVLLVAAVGAVIYVYLSLKVRLADRLLGTKVGAIRRKLKIKPI